MRYFIILLAMILLASCDNSGRDVNGLLTEERSLEIKEYINKQIAEDRSIDIKGTFGKDLRGVKTDWS